MTTSTPEIRSQTIDAYLADLASAAPAPGGGAAVAVTGAQSAALLSMCLNVTGDQAKGLSAMGRNELAKELEAARRRFLELADEDARAFSAVMAAMQLPNASDAERLARATAMQAALKIATEVPIQMMELLGDLFVHAEALIPAVKKTVVSDAGIAVLLADAGLKAARLNVRINLKYLKDAAFTSATEERVDDLLLDKKAKRKDLLSQVKDLI